MKGDRTWAPDAFTGAVTGALAGGVVLAFRWIIEHGQSAFLPDGRVGNYESLPAWAVVALPLGGGWLLGLVFERLRRLGAPTGG